METTVKKAIDPSLTFLGGGGRAPRKKKGEASQLRRADRKKKGKLRGDFPAGRKKGDCTQRNGRYSLLGRGKSKAFSIGVQRGD